MKMKLHHVGVVTNNVQKYSDRMARQFGLEAIGPAVDDNLQKSRVLVVNTNTDVCIELIEPIGDDSPVSNTLKKGGGIAHLCYEVNDMDDAIAHLKSTGALVVSEPKPSAAFSDCQVAFVFTKDHELIELISALDFSH